MRRRSSLVLLAALAVALGVGGLVLAAEGEERPPAESAGVERPPAAREPIPSEPRALGAALADTRTRLYAAIDRWRAEGDPARGGAPRDVALLALHHQRIVRRLARRPRLERAVLRELPRRLAAETRDLVRAPRELGLIRSVRRGPPPRIRTARAQPADVLRAHYARAWRRFGVGSPLLAAVNFVETNFGKLRNRSISGAQGPMQFMPATWKAYGLGGDVHDPRDAILGAANYLHASGAPGDERRALYRYNPSSDYVRAVSRYARRFRADERAFYALYAWQVYIGDRRLTAFGL